MTWFDVMKIEFFYDEEEDASGQHSRATGPRINLAQFRHYTDDEKLSEKLVNVIIHESAHSAVDTVAMDEYYLVPALLIRKQLSNLHAKIIALSFGSKQEIRQGNIDTADINSEKIKDAIDKMAAYNLMDEIFASHAGKDEAASRIVLERYVEKNTKRFTDLFTNSIEEATMTFMESMKDKINIGSIQTRANLINQAMYDTIQSLAKYYKEKQHNYLLKILKVELELDIEPGFYKELLREIIRAEGFELLDEYLKTGNKDLLMVYKFNVRLMQEMKRRGLVDEKGNLKRGK
tara:strand:- start:557 stop:1429 length:873 start_codon:yes stop_codon:yes gene_type:complete